MAVLLPNQFLVNDIIEGIDENDLASFPKISEIQNIFSELINNLSEQEQIICSLYYDEELSLAEISQILDLDENDVKRIRTTTILKLRVKFKDTFMDQSS